MFNVMLVSFISSFETWGETFTKVSHDFFNWLFIEGTICWYAIMFLALLIFTWWNNKFNKNAELQKRIESFLPPLKLIPFIGLAILLVAFLYIPIVTTIENYQINKKYQSYDRNNANEAECDPAYPDICIPSPPPDLDCGDIPFRNFRVVGSDPHWFDVDDDGWGCEAIAE
jgi:hypothetical protein